MTKITLHKNCHISITWPLSSCDLCIKTDDKLQVNQVRCDPIFLNSSKKVCVFHSFKNHRRKVVMCRCEFPFITSLTYMYVDTSHCLWHGSQIRPQLSTASSTNAPQPKVIITKVIISLCCGQRIL